MKYIFKVWIFIRICFFSFALSFFLQILSCIVFLLFRDNTIFMTVIYTVVHADVNISQITWEFDRGRNTHACFSRVLCIVYIPFVPIKYVQ